MSFVIKRNDTVPSLEAQLIDADGSPVNLDMCGVKLHMFNNCSTRITKNATIVDIMQGRVRVDWEDSDTAVAGVYKCEFEIIFTDSSVLTVPNDGYFLISITPDIG